MRKNTCLLLILALCCLCNRAVSQSAPDPSNYSKPIDIIPPSPNAAALGKYGGIPLNYSTGMMNMSVPIYDYASVNIHVPISLSYNSSGFRVDEIASRVGTSWSLDAGGVITRTVFGRIDEKAQRASLPADYPAQSRNLIDFMQSLYDANVDGGTRDGQPDVFSFNVGGSSGKFILDASNNPVLLTHSNIRIESNFSASADWNFRITTGDGVRYEFGAAGAEVTNKSQSGTGCGKIYNSPAITAWYLTRIIHPNNDTVTFSYTMAGISYESGVSEAMYQRNTAQVPSGCPGYPVQPPVFDNTACMMRLSTQEALLQEINSSGGARMRFIYIDRSDVNNDKLLSGIEVYKPGQASPFKVFSLDYLFNYASSFLNDYSYGDASLRYRPFLTGLTEKSPDNLLTKKYVFSYNDLSDLPPRLSYAQDSYGFFNGKSNWTLVPRSSMLTWQEALPNATANRNPDPSYCMKGLLSKIIYPTGGQDSIVYEGNTIYATVPVYVPPVTVSIGTHGTGNSGLKTVNSSPISILQKQDIRFTGACSFDAGLGYDPDPLHNRAIVTLTDLTTGEVLFDQNILAGDHVTEVITLYNGRDYQVTVTASGLGTSGAGSFYYTPGPLTFQNINQVTGGLRIAKVITNDNATAVPMIKKYDYSSLDRPGISSGGAIYQPIYEKYLQAYIPCMSGLSQGGPSCDVTSLGYYSIYSNTQNNLYIYPAAPVCYGAVVESFGENYENGGIERKYTLSPNRNGLTRIGEFIQGSPQSDYSWRNGRQVSEFTFNKQGSSYLPVKKVYTHYNEDARINQSITGYVVNKKYNAPCQSNIPDETELNSFDMVEYFLFREWVYVDSVRTLTYDNSGQNYVEELVATNYANPDHAMPTSISSVSSDNRSLVVNNAYPYDIVLSGSAETARQALIAKHIISPVLQQQSLKGGAPVVTTRTDYAVFPNSLVLPESQFLQTGNNSPEKRVDFAAYNNNGRLVEQSKANDVKLAYQWGYNSLYPVAQAVNARSNEIFFNGFEEGGWDGNMTAYDNTKSHTGAWSGRIDKPGAGEQFSHNNTWLNVSLSAPVKYRYSGWVYSTGPGVELFLFMKRAGETSYFTYVDANVNYITGKWVYMEKEFTVPADVTQLNMRVDNNGGGTVWFDDIRLCPAAARMTTYTYDPLTGLTSQCDDRNNVAYYEYDKLDRLLRVRDLDGNILKQYEYEYQYQPYSTNPNWSATGNTRCKPCAANGAYNTDVLQQEEKDMNPYSVSYNTTQWTDAGTSSSCVITPNWQNVGGIRCRTDGAGNNTSEQEQQQQDMNPCSPSGGGTRWVVVATNCSACPKPANWQPTGNLRCAKDGSGINTGQQEREEVNVESCSTSGGSTRWMLVDYYVCSTCPKPENWQSLGNLRCAKDGAGNNTGYQERQEVNTEACSSTYGNTRWVINSYNVGSCPMAIYAKVKYTDYVYSSDRTTANVWINFYADENCTIPTSVSNLNVNYREDYTICGEEPNSSDNTVNNVSGTQVSLGSHRIDVHDGIHCYRYRYYVTDGSGYIRK